MATDSPDWQEVVTLTSGGSVPDAPDWQRTVTGPGAASISSAFPPHLTTVYVSTAVELTTSLIEIMSVSGNAAVNQFCQVAFGCQATYSTSDAATDGINVAVYVAHVVYGANSHYCIPGYVATEIIQPVILSFWTFIPAGAFGFSVQACLLGTASGFIGPANGAGGNYGLAVAYT